MGSTQVFLYFFSLKSNKRRKSISQAIETEDRIGGENITTFADDKSFSMGIRRKLFYDLCGIKTDEYIEFEK